jgi:drug/metabolite transporter (DMT)-like permease
MRLNFWQWLGVLLLIIGVVFMINKYATHWWGTPAQSTTTTTQHT